MAVTITIVINLKLKEMKLERFSTVLTIVALGASFWLSSCKKSEPAMVLGQAEKVKVEDVERGPLEEASIQSEDFSRIAQATKAGLNVSPAAGSSVPSSSGVLSGFLGSFAGGILEAKVLSFSAPALTIEASWEEPFTSGTVELRSGSVCGPIMAQQTFVSGQKSVVLSCAVNLTTGIVVIYPVLRSTGNYWASPIHVYSEPMCFSSTSFGSILGTVNGVHVYCGLPGYNSHRWSYLQGICMGKCWEPVEFVNSYYKLIYGKNITQPVAGAHQYFYTASQRGLKAYPNGTAIPREGMIVCMSGGPEGTGMLAIVIEVGETWIKVAFQGSGNPEAIGFKISRTGPTLQTPMSGYNIQGLLSCI